VSESVIMSTGSSESARLDGEVSCGLKLSLRDFFRKGDGVVSSVGVSWSWGRKWKWCINLSSFVSRRSFACWSSL